MNPIPSQVMSGVVCHSRINVSVPHVERVCLWTTQRSVISFGVLTYRYYLRESKGSKRWLLFLEGEETTHTHTGQIQLQYNPLKCVCV